MRRISARSTCAQTGRILHQLAGRRREQLRVVLVTSAPRGDVVTKEARQHRLARRSIAERRQLVGVVRVRRIERAPIGEMKELGASQGAV
jgi:ribosomal protein L34E